MQIINCGLLYLVAGIAMCQLAIADTPEERPSATGDLYVYPSGGQDEMQVDRDRYECHVWAVKQTGFDPSDPTLAPHQQVNVVSSPAPAMQRAIVGAIAGAVIGAAVTGHRDHGNGVITGAIAGAVVGAATADESNPRQRPTTNSQEVQRAALLEKQSESYRRAISACLEGRGYTVK